MDGHAISFILASLSGLQSVSQQADAMFNARLLDTHPDVYRRFSLDVAPQDRRLLEVLGLILGHMRQSGVTAPIVKVLARSHRVFRLIDAHYEALAETLIWTLRRSLGDSFPIEAERAWLEALWRARQAEGPGRREGRARNAAVIEAGLDNTITQSRASGARF